MGSLWILLVLDLLRILSSSSWILFRILSSSLAWSSFLIFSRASASFLDFSSSSSLFLLWTFSADFFFGLFPMSLIRLKTYRWDWRDSPELSESLACSASYCIFSLYIFTTSASWSPVRCSTCSVMRRTLLYLYLSILIITRPSSGRISSKTCMAWVWSGVCSRWSSGPYLWELEYWSSLILLPFFTNNIMHNKFEAGFFTKINCS